MISLKKPPAFGFSTGVGVTLIDVGPTRQIVESADAVPPVTIAFQHNAATKGIESSAELRLWSTRVSGGSAQRIGVNQFAVQHYYPRLAQIGDSLRGIAFHEHKVGDLIDFD